MSDTEFYVAAIVTLVATIAGCNGGCASGKYNARRYHCESQGYAEHTVDARGTITCIKVTREAVK